MSDFVPSEIVHLSSEKASSTGLYNTDCVFRLNKQISAPSEYQLYVSLINLKVPFTWYSIDKKNDTFFVTYDDSSFSQIKIPHGFYAGDGARASGPQLALAIQKELNTNSAYDIWTVTFNYNTFQLDFSIDMSKATTVTVIPDNIELPVGSTLWKNFGLESENETILFTSNGSLYSASTGILRLNIVEDIYLRCSLISDHVYECNPQGGGESNILSKVTVDRAPGQFIDLYPNNKNAIALSRNQIDDFRLMLTDIDGNLLDLQHVPWTATIRFDYRQGVSNAKYAKPKKVSQ